MIIKSAFAVLLFSGSLAFADVSVIIHDEKAADSKPMTEAQKEKEALFQQRIRERNAKCVEDQKAHDEFVRKQREMHHEEALERKKAQREWEEGLKK